MSQQTLIREGAWLARTGRQLEAKNLFQQLAQNGPPNEIIWLWLYDLADGIEEQMIALEKVLEVNPQNYMAKRRLTELQQRQKALSRLPAVSQKTPAFETLSDEAPAVTPAPRDYVEIQVERATAALHRGDYPEAYAILSYIVKFCHPTAAVWFWYSYLAHTLDEAISALEKAIMLDPDYAEAEAHLLRLWKMAEEEDGQLKYIHGHARANPLHFRAVLLQPATPSWRMRFANRAHTFLHSLTERAAAAFDNPGSHDAKLAAK